MSRVGDVFSTLSTYVGSTYVNQFNKFGLTFQVYVQADAQFRLRPGGYRATCRCAADQGRWCRWARWRDVKPAVGPALISLYNLYPSATIIGGAGAGLQLRPGAGR